MIPSVLEDIVVLIARSLVSIGEFKLQIATRERITMQVSRAVLTFCIGLGAMALTSSTPGQQAPNPVSVACGPTKMDFNVSKETAPPGQAPPGPAPIAAGQALVYIVESMPQVPFVTKKVNIGKDGAWLGATDANTYMSFSVTPGVHHLCAVYQGHAAGMDAEGNTLLLRLNAQAGHTYYVNYHGMFFKDSPSIAFFNFVDEDEGPLLLQRSQHAVSVAKH
jgi:hypothetical protein